MRVLTRRVMFYIITAWAAISLNFLLPRLMPGSPADAVIQQFGGKLSPEAAESIRIMFGQSDAPLIVQYVDYWRSIFTGDFGLSSAYYPSSVVSVIGDSIGWTLGLVTLATIISFVLGTTIGAIAGWRRGTWLDSLVPATTFISSIPYFWLAIVLIYTFSITLNWLPSNGAYGIATQPGWNWPFILDVMRHGLLPALSIVIASIGGWILAMRNMMVTTLSEQYVLLAEAKGLRNPRIMLAYAARNAILPSVSSFAMSLGFVVGGSLVAEVVFNYPGIGSLLFKAVRGSDYGLMQAIFLAITLMVLLANFLADIAYMFIDPRTRQES